MDTPTPPAPPDPTATAAAQSASNKATAVSQYGLNATNQVTPTGNLTYSQIGNWEDGTPRFQATTSLSPSQQGLYDLGNQTQQNLGKIGVEQSAAIGNRLNTPFSLGNEQTESRLFDLGSKRLDPLYAQREEAVKSDLMNRGVLPGSEAYQRELDQVGRDRNDAYNQLLLTGRGTADTEMTAERNQPINEITALLSGSQVQQPGFTNTPSPGIAPTDVIGAQQQSLNQGNVAFNAANQRQQALMTGLFGLGKTALGGWATGGLGGGMVNATPGFAE